jgi:dipeptidyl aminopeptidase/acylaminoacyl peptidase
MTSSRITGWPQCLILLGLVASDVLLAAPGTSAEQVTAADYARAERFLPWNASKYVLNGDVAHNWIGTADQLWYQERTRDGKTFWRVDANTGKRQTAFDHEAIARALAHATQLPVDPRQLPFDSFEFVGAERALKVALGGKTWICGAVGDCTEAEPVQARRDELPSPDGKWAVYLKDNDLWLRSLIRQEERPLTTDGEPHYGYGSLAGSSLMVITLSRQDAARTPVGIWSADSTKFLTHRLDERAVRDLYYLQSVPEDGSVRPVLHSVRFAMPQDKQGPGAQLVVFDVVAGTRTDMKFPPLPVTTWTPLVDSRAWWGTDARTVYVLPREIEQKRLRLFAMDTASGEMRLLIEESAPKTYIEAGGMPTRPPDIRVLRSGEIIWYSERDDWGHLYLYSSRGQLKRQLTSGAWRIMRIVRVDEEHRRIYFLGVGRERGEDPYQRHLYAVDLDNSRIHLLTPENADHDLKIYAPGYFARTREASTSPAQAAFAPSGRYFVETYSRPDLPSTTVLRRKDGTRVAVLATADVTPLQADGFVPPEPFRVLAADGRTSIYGNILRPSRLDPRRKYPVIDAIYPGPQGIRTAKTFMASVFDWDHAQALAELGFIVVTIDGRGTSFRSKSFHDVGYGNLQDAGGLQDHIAGLRALATRYPYMDLERVGIYGHSGGGYGAARAILNYPEFYKVAIASAGNHDQRAYTLMWGPTYQGPYAEASWAPQINARLAERLQGRLFLIHGDMDDNVHPAMTLQLADALIKANKDFDMLIVPNANHEMSGAEAYFTRRRWDYFVRHLLGAQPPKDHQIIGPQEGRRRSRGG